MMIRILLWCLLAMGIAACSGSEDDTFIDLRRARYVFYGVFGEQLRETKGPKSVIMDRLLERVLLANGAMVDLTVSASSGLYRSEADPEGLYYALTDRGPALHCSQTSNVTGKPVCENGTVFVLPEYTPAIHILRLDFDTGEYETMAELPLRAGNWVPASGLPNDLAQGESAFSAFGDDLPLDVAGLDPEALVRLSDGTFWLAEEYGPSLVHVGPDGLILGRFVPQGRERVYSQAPYPVYGTLPVVYATHERDSGFAALAVSKEESGLTVIMESPLPLSGTPGNPCRIVRILVIDLKTMRPSAEYVYLLDAASGKAGEAAGSEAQPRVTEAVALNRDTLLVMEWLAGRTRIYMTELREATNLLASAEFSSGKRLVETADIQALGIKPAAKNLVLEINDPQAGASPLEAMTLLHPNTLVVAGDNAYGLQGQPTVFRQINILEQQTSP